MSSLGQRLRKARENKGWSQTYVCQKLGISNSGLSGYERGYREPDADMISALAKLYEVTTDYLLGRSKHPKLSSGSDELLKNLDLTDEELLTNFDFELDGKKLSVDEIKDFIAFVRTKRNLVDKK